MKSFGLGMGLVVLTSCSLFPATPQTHSLPPEFKSLTGKWSGTVDQQDTQSRYTVKLNIRPVPLAGGVVGTSDYPSLGCGGTLVAVGRRGETAVVREVLTYGQQECLNNILLYLRANKNGTLTYTFYRSGTSVLPEPNGRAVLHRERFLRASGSVR